MGRAIINVGEVFEISLSDGRKSYGQYVFFDKRNGPIIRIFDYFTKGEEVLDISKLDRGKLLFPPVYAGVGGAVKHDGWKVMGSMPVDDYIFLGFLYFNTEIVTKPGEPVRIANWSLWDGENYIELGEKLPEKYQAFESVGISPARMIEERIETGFNMEEYPKKYNRFLTKEEVQQKYPTIKI
jgi:hypothetical protein